MALQWHNNNKTNNKTNNKANRKTRRSFKVIVRKLMLNNVGFPSTKS